MMINGRGKVYMIDRENSVFSVRNLQFPHRKDMDKHLSNTLLDGEFVMDVDPNSGQKIPRFLIYDIIKFENDDVGKVNFQIRLQCITKEIIFARDEACRQGKLNKQIEPFSIRQKLFYRLGDTKKLLSKDFEKQITHGIDGLIYQPCDDVITLVIVLLRPFRNYIPGRNLNELSVQGRSLIDQSFRVINIHKDRSESITD